VTGAFTLPAKYLLWKQQENELYEGIWEQ
jgi:hypothetical protein